MTEAPFGVQTLVDDFHPDALSWEIPGSRVSIFEQKPKKDVSLKALELLEEWNLNPLDPSQVLDEQGSQRLLHPQAGFSL